jgi:hypothetical protein
MSLTRLILALAFAWLLAHVVLLALDAALARLPLLCQTAFIPASLFGVTAGASWLRERHDDKQ